MDFLRRSELDSKPSPSPSTERWLSPERRRMELTLFSKKDLNSDGANSGWTRAGTQSSLEGSFSSSSPVGAIEGIEDRVMGMSGSTRLPTSIDRRLSACRLLSSWAMSLGLSMLVSGNWEPDESACTSRRESGAGTGEGGPRWLCSSELDRCGELGRCRVCDFLRPRSDCEGCGVLG